MIRQKVFLMARGTVLVGFLASAAVIPTISVPMKEKPAESNTLSVPRPPPAKAPGSFQYLKPITPAPRPPVVTHKPVHTLLIRENKGCPFNQLTNDDEYKNNQDFKKSKPVLKLTIESNSNQIDKQNKKDKDSRPSRVWHDRLPPIDDGSSSRDFYKQSNQFMLKQALYIL